MQTRLRRDTAGIPCLSTANHEPGQSGVLKARSASCKGPEALRAMLWHRSFSLEVEAWAWVTVPLPWDFPMLAGGDSVAGRTHSGHSGACSSGCHSGSSFACASQMSWSSFSSISVGRSGHGPVNLPVSCKKWWICGCAARRWTTEDTVYMRS